MSASLVGSEMCIRDSCNIYLESRRGRGVCGRQIPRASRRGWRGSETACACLLYTSDAADDM
eukprot:5906453-Alexandrium_andersonii.AAC.1